MLLSSQGTVLDPKMTINNLDLHQPKNPEWSLKGTTTITNKYSGYLHAMKHQLGPSNQKGQPESITLLNQAALAHLLLGCICDTLHCSSGISSLQNTRIVI